MDMKRNFRFSSLMFALFGWCFSLWAQPSADFEIKLPACDGSQSSEVATLRLFLPVDVPGTGRIVIACPGGAYQHLAYDHEGIGWASFFNNQGIALAVLKYRMPCGNRTLPMADLKTAITMVRDSAYAWGINPHDVGVMGSSAGGHLASTAACHFDKKTRPDFQILFYPIITMDEKRTNRATRQNFLGMNPADELVMKYSNELQVNAKTPRAFIARSKNDSPAGSDAYYRALLDNGVPAEYHVYPSGGHGWGIKKSFPHREQMLDELTTWLKSFQQVTKKGRGGKRKAFKKQNN